MYGRTEAVHTGIGNLGSWYSAPAGALIAKVVAVEGNNQDWAAYSENPYTRERGNTDEIIASSGTKLRATEATEIFSEIADRLPYRD